MLFNYLATWPRQAAKCDPYDTGLDQLAGHWPFRKTPPERGQGSTDVVVLVTSLDKDRVRLWLQADIQPPEIEVCFTPNTGHSRGLLI